MISPAAITLEEANAALDAASAAFAVLFDNSDLTIELYRPAGVDLQTPHARDEVYVVVAGTGQFRCADQLHAFEPGDVFVAPAHTPHKFVSFSDDFVTWVIFSGPAR